MKQAIFTFYLLIFFSFSAFSQGLYMEIEGGPGFPVGTFRSATGLPGGNVHAGIQGGGAVGFSVNELWSLGIRTMYTRNYMDTDPRVNYSHPPLWQSASVLFTAQISQPISEYLYVEAEAQLGNMWRILRSIERRENPLPSGRAVGVRLGTKYYFSEKIAYQVSVNYLHGNVTEGNIRTGGTQNISLTLFNMGVMIEL